MSKSEERWYHRGKEARMHGADRRLHDLRVTHLNRNAWYSGWDAQDRHMQPERTEGEIAESDRVLAKLKTAVRETIKPSPKAGQRFEFKPDKALRARMNAQGWAGSVRGAIEQIDGDRIVTRFEDEQPWIFTMAEATAAFYPNNQDDHRS